MRYGFIALALLFAAPAFAEPYPQEVRDSYTQTCDDFADKNKAFDDITKIRVKAACQCKLAMMEDKFSYADYVKMTPEKMAADPQMQKIDSDCLKILPDSTLPYYTQPVAEAFINSCNSESAEHHFNAEMATKWNAQCLCTFEGIRAKIPYKEFIQMSPTQVQGDPRLHQIAVDCAKKQFSKP